MRKQTSIRLAVTLLTLFLLLAVFVPPLTRAVFESAPFKRADAAGLTYVDAAFDRALIAFALARTANAVISVIQGSELDVAPAGVGMTLAVGEALDPLNDMIERFSWVMLLSLVSLGIQKLLLEMVPWLSLTLVLAPALILLLAGLWWPSSWQQQASRLGARLLLLALVLRFCVPLTAWVNDRLYERFMASRYTAAIGEFEQGNELLQTLNPLSIVDGAETKAGLIEQLKAKAQRLQQAADLQRQFDALKARFNRMIEQLLTMLAVFLLNSVLLPIGFLWLLAGGARRVLAGFTFSPSNG